MAETETVEQIESPAPAAESADPVAAVNVPDIPITPEVPMETAEVPEASPAEDPAAQKEIQFPDTPEIQRILQLEVPIIVRLAGKIMPLGEIMQLQPGAIIEFNKVIGEDLDLMINNKCIGGGQAVKVGEKFGLKVTQIATIDKMIMAMGGK